MSRLRIRRLEKELGAGVPCAECGGPNDTVHVYMANEGPPGPRVCPTCGRKLIVRVSLSGNRE